MPDFGSVRKWTKGRFVMDSGYYAGRGPTQSDLSSSILEMFYTGIKKDIGVQEAKNFVRFVNKLDDLSASAFIVAFERFVARHYKDVNIPQEKEDGNRLTGRGPGLEAQGFALLANVLAGSKRSDAETKQASVNIKYEFIRYHLEEIPESERRDMARASYAF